ncbi:MAG: hypothetical protein ABEJ28_10275 [Salinigranum sp.]
MSILEAPSVRVSPEPGTNVLITGPVLTGKRTLLLSLLAAGATEDRPSLLVTTRADASSVVREFSSLGGAADRLDVVDCVSRSYLPERRVDEPGRRYVSNPGDLTGIGIAATEALHRFSFEDVPGRVGLHSLSTMVMYADTRRLFQFLHVLTGRIRVADNVGMFVLDDAAVDDREFEILTQPFDARIEVREDDDGDRQIRVRGDDIGPRTWTPL